MPFFMTFILPVLVFLIAGALIGLGLAFLHEKFKAERDPRVDEVLKYLPGFNCGGCGSAGCDAFAGMLVKGGAKVAACNPCPSENKEKIGKILGLDVTKSRKTVAVVHCAGGKGCLDKEQNYNDCRSAAEAGGAKACGSACLGLSSCASVCKYHGIAVDKDTGAAVVNRAICISCGACVSACPQKIISRIPAGARVYVGCSNTLTGKEVRPVCPSGCIACGRCQKECPVQAITVFGNLAVIDYDKCGGCEKCVAVCPTKCMVLATKERCLL